jgi:predicted RNA polymerase sigma factor
MRAHHRLGLGGEAVDAHRVALGLEPPPAERAFIVRRIRKLTPPA